MQVKTHGRKSFLPFAVSRYLESHSFYYRVSPRYSLSARTSHHVCHHASCMPSTNFLVHAPGIGLYPVQLFICAYITLYLPNWSLGSTAATRSRPVRAAHINRDLMPASDSGHSGIELARSRTRCDLRFFFFILAPVFDPLRGGGVSV